jgi:hypothetical protein
MIAISEVVVPVLASRYTWAISVGLLIAAAIWWPRAAWFLVAVANVWGVFEGASRKRAEEAVRERREVEARAKRSESR